ncbi:hypothetical protein [Conyzicola sp.]|uniref:hypothetical protein n=1 Tax=Conyzicola sp. TaxID=1969404 RepID=UPI00398A479D
MTETHTTTSTDPAPLKPRIGTIVWGSILLIVAAIAIFASQVDFGDATPAAIVWSVVGFGAVLVVAGIVTAIVRAARKDTNESDLG